MKKNYLNFKTASLALSFVAIFGATGVKAQVLVAGSVIGTTPTTYTSLSSAFAAINTGTHTGAITVSITANTTEPASPTALLASGGTSSYSSVLIRPAGGNFTVNSNATPSANRGIIELAGADNVTIDGDDPATAGLQNLSIVSAQTTLAGVACIRLASNSITGADGANNNTVKNCVIRGSKDVPASTVVNYGIQFSDMAAGVTSSASVGANASINTVIQGNTITRCFYGIHAIGNSTTYLNTGLSIASNTLGVSATATDNVSFRGIDVSYTEVNPASTNTSTLSLNNIVFGNISAASAVMGIELGSATAGIHVSRNNIHDAVASPLGAYGIGVTGTLNLSNGILIRNNFIRDMKGATLTSAANQTAGIGGIGIMVTGTVTGMLMYHNTIAQLAAGCIGSCVQLNSSSTIQQFRNNVLVNNVSNAFSTCFYSSSTVNISGGTLNNNDYYINPSAGNLAFYNAANRATFANFIAATGMDANSYSVSPNFVSATDLHITPGQFTLLESTGASTAVTTTSVDIDGDVRPGPVGSLYGGAINPDLGADEFDGYRADCIAPTLTVTPSPTSAIICTGSAATLVATGATTYTWSSGTTGSTAVVSPTTTTTYTVIGTNASACTNSAVVTITVNTTPTITAVASATAICLNNSVSITASGNVPTFTLSNGVANGALFSPTNTATYTITGSNACGTGSTAVTITVNALPTLTASISSATICSGNTVVLSVSGTAATYTWATNGSTNTAITLTPAVIGTGSTTLYSYSVTGSSAQGCTATAVTNLTLITTPVVAPISSPPAPCSGTSASLQVSGAQGYTWTSSAGVISNSSLVVVTPATVAVVTNITYTITKNNGSCINTQVLTVTVNPLPSLAAFVNPTQVCAGSQATLTAGGATNYTWSPTTQPANGAIVTITPTITTIYTFTGNNGTCSNTGTINVPVSPVPTLAIASPTGICLHSSVTMTASGATSYTWTGGTLPPNTQGALATDSPTIPTTYNVTGALIYTINTTIPPTIYACTSTTSQIIYINPLPSITITPVNYTICTGKTATITAIAGSTNQFTYQWLNPISSATSVTVNPTSTTIYTVAVSTNSTNCVNTKTASVYVFDQSFSVSPSSSICLGAAVTLTASGANNYIWAPGNLNTPSIPVSPTVTTIYTVTGTSTVVNVTTVVACAAVYTVQITVNPNPTVTAMVSHSVICRQETDTLFAAGASQYAWAPSGTGSGSMVVVNSTDFPNYINVATYTVTGSDAHNCKRTATVQVITSGCVGIEELSGANRGVSIYPNPNNGQFTVSSDGNIILNILNEIGQLVKTISLTDSNQHKVDVSEMSNGIYFIVGSNENGYVKQKVIINK